jgi:hypothetical protein
VVKGEFLGEDMLGPAVESDDSGCNEKVARTVHASIVRQEREIKK